ncbi:MAG TPA: hypothetical protein VMH81_27235 [Bryobacteraceae bacterium]|nr:hypothetical protein [Bryobacteraceae bacterium]
MAEHDERWSDQDLFEHELRNQQLKADRAGEKVTFGDLVTRAREAINKKISAARRQKS